MDERVEQVIKDFFAALQMARLYGVQHQSCVKGCAKMLDSLRAAFPHHGEIVIGFISGELTFGKDILFDLSNVLKPMIADLQEKGIERIVFTPGVEERELGVFIEYLAARKGAIRKTAQEYLSEAGLRHISAGRIKVAQGSGPADLPGGEIADAGDPTGGENILNTGALYQSSLSTVTGALTALMHGEAFEYMALRSSVNGMAGGILTAYRDILKLVTLKRYDPATYVHVLNVSTLTMFFAARSGFTREDMTDLGIAGLFHDVGKTHISRRLIRKTDKLSDEEFGVMKSHTVLGAEVLLEYVDTLGTLPLVVAFEHHLKYDLSGYPKSAFNQKPHTASRVVCICDVYDALSQRRSYKADYAPDIVYSIMIRERGTTFDPDLLDRFFRYLGVWPIGSLVGLSDGRIAVVRDEHEDAIALPDVEVIMPEEKRGERLDLRLTQGTVKIEKFMNPWKEGRELLRLI